MIFYLAVHMASGGKGDDRDVRRPKTPPVGVRAQTAPDSWDGPDQDTGNTPVGEENLSTMNRRVKDTKTAATDTLEHVQGLKSDVTRIDSRLSSVESNITRIDGKVGALDTKFDQLSGTVLGVLASTVSQQQERQTISFEAHVDVDKHAKLAEIAEQRDTKKFARERKLKMLSLAGKVLGLLASGGVVTYLLGRLDGC